MTKMQKKSTYVVYFDTWHICFKFQNYGYFQDELLSATEQI